MKSHALLRTNVGLTTNAKIMVGASYSLYVDSIISNTELSSDKYKRKEFNKNNYWDELLPYFFKNTPPEIAFSIKDDEDNKNMSKDFSKQYDDLYQYGARNIIENKDYSEEFEYFAPLHISKTGLPSNFIIFRIDGPGLLNLTKDNFRAEIINKLKCVKNFDLTRNTALGEWLETNVTKNKNFPNTGLYIDFRNLEFSSWIGIDYEDGGYSEKSFMLDSTLGTEQTYQDFEKFVLDGYKNNKVAYPHILNFSFLFDDTPATPTSIRTWSLNRYMGFYLDAFEFVKYVSPYNLPKIKSDVIIDSNNLLYSLSDNNPFEETFKKEDNPYIEIDGQFYKIERFLEQQTAQITRVQVSRNTFVDRPNQSVITKYKIISNISLEGKQGQINKNLIGVGIDNKISNIDGGSFTIENFDESDVWLIQIDGVFHNLVKLSDGNIYINTDYAFYQTAEKFEYYINDPDPNYRKTISLKVDSETAPKQFGIYRCKFTDVKDFDLDLVDTDYSKFEYMFKERLTTTDETKMYAIDQKSTTSPKDLDDFKINGVVVNIPTSSEYVANNSELFRIINNDLNFLWKKNARRFKWGFQNSISSNDYPYLLNNSFSSEDYNRTCNPYNPSPLRVDRNLDYFLTINADSNVYSHNSLHITDNPQITFTNITQNSTFTRLNGVSDIGYFSVNDIIRINSTNTYYNTTTRISSIDFSNTVGWRITTDLVYTPITGTISGFISNTSRTAFSLDKYLNLNYDSDYFEYFFNKKTSFDSGNIQKNTKKYSRFNTGDDSTPNITLFRGLKFKIWDVTTVKIKDDNIESINIKSNNNYDDWKFGVLLSKNNFSISSDPNSINGATISFGSNLMRWQIVDDWKHDKIYSKDDIVNWNDTIYIALTQSQIVNPSIYPSNSNNWSIYNQKNIFWNSNVDGTGTTTLKNNMLELGQKIFDINAILPPLVFNNQDYYYSEGTSGINFWNPTSNYNIGNIVFYKDRCWISNSNNNRTVPGTNKYFVESSQYRELWTVTNSNSIWDKVELWSSQKDYLVTNSNWNTIFTPGHYVIYDDVVYVTITDTNRGIIPPLDINWKRVYSLVQNTNFQYSSDFNNNFNPIVKMNNRLYLCRQNGIVTNTSTGGRGSSPITTITSLSTLENGINIFINKKWKNVLVNIYVNDNTFSQTINIDNLGTIAISKDLISNTNRDNLYNDIYSKLSANNFMNAINDLSNFYDFSDKIRYIIINEDFSLNLYDFNDLNSVSNLPTLLTCEGPDEFLVKINSLKVVSSTLAVSEIKPKRSLKNGEITSIDQIDYYSDNNLGVTIETNKQDLVKVSNYSGIKNNLYNNLFRHSGNYSPVFKDIELFKTATLSESGGNYKFDTELTQFGKIKERIVSKINRQKNILKLKDNVDLLSIYPMLDEFGYHVISFNIFKSTWDFEYHVECNEISQTPTIIGNQSLQFIPDENGTNNNNLNLL